MNLFTCLAPDSYGEGWATYKLSNYRHLHLHEGADPIDRTLFFCAYLFESFAGQDDSEEVGMGTGDSESAAVIDLLLSLDAGDARIPPDAAQKLSLIAQQAARLIVSTMIEVPLHDDRPLFAPLTQSGTPSRSVPFRSVPLGGEAVVVGGAL